MGGISVLFLFGILSFMYIAFMAVFIGVILYAIISYVFESIAAACICKKRQYRAYGTAWIPFYNKYVLGKLAGSPALGLISGLLNLAAVILSVLCYRQHDMNAAAFGILLLCLLVEFVCEIIVAHKIYKSTSIRYSDVLTVLSVISLGMLRPILLFFVRNQVKEPGNACPAQTE